MKFNSIQFGILGIAAMGLIPSAVGQESDPSLGCFSYVKSFEQLSRQANARQTVNSSNLVRLGAGYQIQMNNGPAYEPVYQLLGTSSRYSERYMGTDCHLGVRAKSCVKLQQHARGNIQICSSTNRSLSQSGQSHAGSGSTAAHDRARRMPGSVPGSAPQDATAWTNPKMPKDSKGATGLVAPQHILESTGPLPKVSLPGSGSDAADGSRGGDSGSDHSVGTGSDEGASGEFNSGATVAGDTGRARAGDSGATVAGDSPASAVRPLQLGTRFMHQPRESGGETTPRTPGTNPTTQTNPQAPGTNPMTRTNPQTAGTDPTTQTNPQAAGTDPTTQTPASVVPAEGFTREEIAGVRVQRHDEYDRDEKKANDDPCAYGKTIDGKYGCKGTYQLTETARTTNEVATTLGSAGLQIMGQKAAMDASNARSQSAAYKSAGKLAEHTAKLQVLQGATNTAFVYLQNKNRKQRRGTSQEISQGNSDEAIRSNYGLDTEIQYVPTNPVSRQGLTEQEYQRQAALQSAAVRAAEERAIKAETKRIRNLATSEQTEAANASKMGMMQSGIFAMQQLVGGIMGYKTAKEMQKAADQMKRAENKGGVMPGFDNPITGEPSVPNQGGGLDLGGNGLPQQPTEVGVNDEDPNGEDEGGLGDPLGGLGDQGKLAGPPPMPGMFQKQDPQGGGGGGGGMMGSSGTSPASEDAQGETGAKYADNGTNATKYGAGGGAGAVFGGGRGGGGGGDDGGGLDMSNLLAQFLPKDEEAPQRAQSILDFGGRMPASQPASLLDRNANLFERISQTYHDKAQRGYVGP